MYVSAPMHVASVCIGYFACYMYVDVHQERSHNALIADVENFQSSSLKRTDTKEKIVLPNAQGKTCQEF